MLASGRLSLKGHRGKEEKSVAPFLLRVSARYLLSELRPNYMTSTKLNGVNRWPGWFFGYFFPPDICAFPFSP